MCVGEKEIKGRTRRCWKGGRPRYKSRKQGCGYPKIERERKHLSVKQSANFNNELRRGLLKKKKRASENILHVHSAVLDNAKRSLFVMKTEVLNTGKRP